MYLGSVAKGNGHFPRTFPLPRNLPSLKIVCAILWTCVWPWAELWSGKDLCLTISANRVWWDSVFYILLGSRRGKCPGGNVGVCPTLVANGLLWHVKSGVLQILRFAKIGNWPNCVVFFLDFKATYSIVMIVFTDLTQAGPHIKFCTFWRIGTGYHRFSRLQMTDT